MLNVQFINDTVHVTYIRDTLIEMFFVVARLVLPLSSFAA